MVYDNDDDLSGHVHTALTQLVALYISRTRCSTVLVRVASIIQRAIASCYFLFMSPLTIVFGWSVRARVCAVRRASVR